ncbi:MAG: GntR family transcriptional regulator [Victivallaceae bacterium]
MKLAPSKMQKMIDKECKTLLPVQICNKLIKAIREKSVCTGSRLPGERMLAEKFGVSRGTIIRALELLENKNYIERIPAKGTFIAENQADEHDKIKIMFPFPEKAITVDSISSMENWGTASELYRGMLAEAATMNAEILFQNFKDDRNQAQYSRQHHHFENFCGAIFIGDQLGWLLDTLLQAKKRCVKIEAKYDPSFHNNISTVSHEYGNVFDEIVLHLKNRGYRRLRFLDIFPGKRNPAEVKQKYSKIECLINAALKYRIESSREWIYQKDNTNSISSFFEQPDLELRNRTEAIFCVYADTVPALYNYCMKKNLILGKDLGVFGYASGVTFNNLTPNFTYCKIDNFTIGSFACRMIIDAVTGGNVSVYNKKVSSKLVVGQST